MIDVQLTHKLERGFAVLFLCVFCAQTMANDSDMYLSDFESFGIEENDFNQMPILSHYQMDSETLFLAAAAERDNSMSLQQRLINNRWLLGQDRDPAYSGTKALRNYLRLYVIQNWKAHRAKKHKDQDFYKALATPVKVSQFKDISNYDLRLSDHRVKIRFRYRFH